MKRLCCSCGTLSPLREGDLDIQFLVERLQHGVAIPLGHIAVAQRDVDRGDVVLLAMVHDPLQRFPDGLD